MFDRSSHIGRWAHHMASPDTRLQAQPTYKGTAALQAGHKPVILVFGPPCALDLLALLRPVEFIYIKHFCSLTPPPSVVIIQFPSLLQSFP